MKHFIGPSNYSTYHSYTQAQARPIQLPDVGSIMSAVGHVNHANEAAEAKIKAAQEKAEAEAAKQAARVANQEFANTQAVRVQHDAEFNSASINNAMIGRARRGYDGYSQEELAAQHADLSEQMRTNFFGRYAANQGQLDASYPSPTYTEMGAGRPIMPPGYQAPVMAPTTSPQSYFKPFGGYHEGYNLCRTSKLCVG